MKISEYLVRIPGDDRHRFYALQAGKYVVSIQASADPQQYCKPHVVADPDTYTHFEVMILRDAAWIKTADIPEAKGKAWGEYFPDGLGLNVPAEVVLELLADLETGRTARPIQSGAGRART